MSTPDAAVSTDLPTESATPGDLYGEYGGGNDTVYEPDREMNGQVNDGMNGEMNDDTSIAQVNSSQLAAGRALAESTARTNPEVTMSLAPANSIQNPAAVFHDVPWSAPAWTLSQTGAPSSRERSRRPRGWRSARNGARRSPRARRAHRPSSARPVDPVGGDGAPPLADAGDGDGPPPLAGSLRPPDDGFRDSRNTAGGRWL